MKNLTTILILLLLTTFNCIAQSISDSLYVVKIDSILLSKNNDDYAGIKLEQKTIEDSTDYKTVIGRWKNGLLVDISYYHSFGGCERARFHLVENALVMVEYQIADPDLYSEGPPSITYKVYFRENKAIMQLSSSYLGGPGPVYCTSYSISKKDFLSELSYYRLLLMKE